MWPSSITSASLGTLRRTRVSRVSRLAIINGNAAFFAPLMGIVPVKRSPPTMRMRSMAFPFLALSPLARNRRMTADFALNPSSYPKRLKTFQVHARRAKIWCSLAFPGAEVANSRAYPRPRAPADHCLEMWQPRGGRVPVLYACRDWHGAPHPSDDCGTCPRFPSSSRLAAVRSWPGLYRRSPAGEMRGSRPCMDFPAMAGSARHSGRRHFSPQGAYLAVLLPP